MPSLALSPYAILPSHFISIRTFNTSYSAPATVKCLATSRTLATSRYADVPLVPVGRAADAMFIVEGHRRGCRPRVERSVRAERMGSFPGYQGRGTYRPDIFPLVWSTITRVPISPIPHPGISFITSRFPYFTAACLSPSLVIPPSLRAWLYSSRSIMLLLSLVLLSTIQLVASQSLASHAHAPRRSSSSRTPTSRSHPNSASLST